MAKTAKQQAMFVINVQEEEAKCTESQLDILLKIHDGQYRLVKKYKRSSVWNVYREIARPDGSKLKWRYYCTGCKRVMQSTGGTTSNLRIHKCHVRYLKQHGRNGGQQQEREQHQQPQRSHINIQRLPAATKKQRQATSCEEIYQVKTDQYSDVEEDEEDYESSTQLDSPEVSEMAPSERPLLKLFSEEDSWSPEITEVQPIEMDHVTEEHSQDFNKETIKPNSAHSIHIDATAISEAESYARAWAHAFLKLSEDQKVYAKRSIDELLILGRLERLNISTVTSLTTNL
ncbi:hypothetical protein KR044_008096 [Drosophila immigrans]|nr:hypothetical protein KR044_008096 [Drosophila immigrans]